VDDVSGVFDLAPPFDFTQPQSYTPKFLADKIPTTLAIRRISFIKSKVTDITK
jgi:hypothetical protein